MDESRLLEVEKKVAAQEVLVSRFDNALDKISEVSLNVSKLLAVHEQRLETQEETSRKLGDRADELHSRVSSAEQRLRTEMTEHQKEILTEIKGLRSEMTNLSDELSEQHDDLKTSVQKDIDQKLETVNARVTKLERLSWLVVGGAAAVGVIVSYAFSFITALIGG